MRCFPRANSGSQGLPVAERYRMGRAKATDKMSADGLKLRWTKRGARSDNLGAAAVISATGERAAQRIANSAHKRANAACNCEAHAANAIALERRKLGVKVVNIEPHRQRHVPPMEVRRAEHGHVSERISFDSHHTDWV